MILEASPTFGSHFINPEAFLYVCPIYSFLQNSNPAKPIRQLIPPPRKNPIEVDIAASA